MPEPRPKLGDKDEIRGGKVWMIPHANTRLCTHILWVLAQSKSPTPRVFIFFSCLYLTRHQSVDGGAGRCVERHVLKVESTLLAYNIFKQQMVGVTWNIGSNSVL